MIEDKSLERAVRTAAKRGLLIRNDGTEMTLGCDDWMATVLLDDMRERMRGTLGAIVEMLGYVPTGCVTVYKAKTDFYGQIMMEDEAGAKIAGFVGDGTVQVKYTPLAFGANRLVQAKDGRIYGVAYGAPVNACRDIGLNSAGCLVAEDGDLLYIRTGRPDEWAEERKHEWWTALEQVQWVDWEDEV